MEVRVAESVTRAEAKLEWAAVGEICLLGFLGCPTPGKEPDILLVGAPMNYRERGIVKNNGWA